MSAGPTFAAPREERDPLLGGLGLAFRNPRMARLLGTCLLVLVSEWAVVTSLSIYVIHGHEGLLALGFIGFRAIPGAISGMFLAPFWATRRHALLTISLARSVIVVLAGLEVMDEANVAAIIALIAVDSAISGPYRAAQGRVMPHLTRDPAVVVGASAGMSIMRSLGAGLGGLAGGLLAAVTAPGPVILGGAALMAVSGLITLGITVPGGGAAANWLERIREAAADLPIALTHSDASSLVWAALGRTLLRGMWHALGVLVALELLHLHEEGVGMFSGAAGIGALIGIPLTTMLIGRRFLGGPCSISFVIAGLAISSIGIFHWTETVAIVIAVWGAGMAVADATSLSLLHRLLPTAMVNRVVEMMESLKVGTEGIGSLLAPLLVSLFDLKTAVIIAGIPLPVIILLGQRQIRRADRKATGRSELVRLLHHVRILRGLDLPSLEDVAGRVSPLRSEAGQDVITQGTVGDRFYVIRHGEAEVLVGGFPVAHLHGGSGFGERALLRGAPRSATVRGVSDLDLLALDRGDFLSAITGLPAEEIDDEIRRRHAAAVASRPLAEVLADLTQLHGASRERLEQMARDSTRVQWAAGEEMISEGSEPDCVYVVLSGRGEVFADGRVVNVVHPGDVFGEISVLHGTPRTATVVAVEPTTTARVPAGSFRGAAVVEQ